MNIARIRGFLLMSPRPSAVRVSRDDGGEPTVLRPRNYARTAETIAALLPDLIEVLDKDGNVLRAQRAEGVDTVANPSEDVGIPEALKTDPLAAAFMMYGRLLAKAYEHSTEVAFSKMVELADRMNERSDSIERRLERTEGAYRQVQQDRIDEAFERVDEAAEKATEGDGIAPFVQSFLGGLTQQPPPPKAEPRPPARARTNGHSNGKGQA